MSGMPWTERKEESLWRRLALSPLLPLSRLYATGACLNRKAFATGLRKQRKLPCRVLSVGNIVVGGSGKTPTVAWLANQLAARGVAVAIASRGYGRKSAEPVVVVSDGHQLCADLDAAGDEPSLLAKRCPGVPILVGPDRHALGVCAVEKFGTELLLLDDGFQHMRLVRDLDLITFDGSFGLGNGHVLPRGPLREPLSALTRAQAFLILDGPLPEADEQALRALCPQAHWFAASRIMKSLRTVWNGQEASLDSLSGVKVGLLAGLANPANFRRSVEQLGAHVVAERYFPDHHPYVQKDLVGLEKEAALWLTTEKDAVKIQPDWDLAKLLHIVEMDLEVSGASSFLDALQNQLR